MLRFGLAELHSDARTSYAATEFRHSRPDRIRPRLGRLRTRGRHRADVQKQVYFKTGEKATGTMSPKAIEYQVNDRGR